VGSATLADNHPSLVLDSESAKAVAALETDRQREVATDFATNQRFRRDVFARGHETRTPDEATSDLFATVIGSARAPSAIGGRAAVPRGEIGFHEGFIRDVRALMARGSVPIADAVASLSQHGGNAEEIARNLIFLVAAGVLLPFARAHAVDNRAPGGEPRATPMLERAIACAIGEQKGCTVPSEVMGNGFPLDPDEARAVQAALSGAVQNDGTRELMATLERIGLLTTHV
jgi:hypothetical protein